MLKRLRWVDKNEKEGSGSLSVLESGVKNNLSKSGKMFSNHHGNSIITVILVYLNSVTLNRESRNISQTLPKQLRCFFLEDARYISAEACLSWNICSEKVARECGWVNCFFVSAPEDHWGLAGTFELQTHSCRSSFSVRTLYWLCSATLWNTCLML